MRTNIIQYPDPFLKVPTDTVLAEDFDKLPHVHKTLKEAMEEYNAVGIAANQLGQNVRACLVGEDFLVNPIVVDSRGDISYELEGCLSIDYGMKGYIRPADEQVIVYYQNIEGDIQHKRFEGFEARVALHEIRHLDGKLINEGHENE